MGVWYNLHSVSCRSCIAYIEQRIKKLPGVIRICVDKEMSRLYIEGKLPSLEELGVIMQEVAPGSWIEMSRNNNQEVNEESGKAFLFLLGACVGVFITGLVARCWLYEHFGIGLTNICFFGLPYIVCGWGVLKKGFESIQKKDFFNEFTLMGGATIVAIILGDFPEAVGVMLFYQVGEYVQDRATGSSRRSIKALLATKPSVAHVVDGSTIQDMDPEFLELGTKFLVKPGEKIPLDGIVESGASQIDTSPLTGESAPVNVDTGSKVFGGTINLMGSLQVKATAKYKDSSVSKILELVENAVGKKAPTERFITRFARYYTPLVFVCAVFVAVIPPLLGLGSLKEWVYRGLVVMVISCPCALLISVPLGYFGGIGAASRRGILVKGGNVLDAIRAIKIVAFDKTGTLTKAQFSVVNVIVNEGFSRDEVLETAAIGIYQSTHPVVSAVLDAFELSKDVSHVKIQEKPGHGVVATYKEHTIIVGNDKLLLEHGIKPMVVDNPNTFVHVVKDAMYLGVIVIADTLKSDAVEAIARIKQYVNRIVMLTGDRKEVARWVAKSLHIDEYKAGLLPEGKATALEELGDSKTILFVGDGINDAPVLALSGVGVAMGGLGSEAAIEVADAVILDDSPGRVADLINIARRTHSIILQNITLALTVKGIVMFFGIYGLSSLWEAVFADVGVALLAVLNATRAGILLQK